MKTILLAALLLAAVPALAQIVPPTEQSAGTIEALDAKNGFRTYKLGALISDYPNLKRRGKGEYTAPGESLKIGDVKLNSISFKEYNGKLSAIVFGTTGATDIDKLLTILVAQYGPGQPAGYNLQSWKGKVVTMICQGGGTPSFPFALVMISSNELDAQRDAEVNKAAKKAAGDL